MAKENEWGQTMINFLNLIGVAKTETHIQRACDELKDFLIRKYPKTPNSRRKPMIEARAVIRDRYPVQAGKSADEEVSFPYFFTDSGKGKIARFEHLAIKYLKEEWNTKPVETVSEIAETVETPSTVEEVKPVLTTHISLESLGLSEGELLAVKEAIADADINEWIKQAIMQRANTVNKLRKSLNEDWSSIPSEDLMNEKKYRTNSGACRELVSRAVRVVKQWNHDHPEHKWCITNKLISELTGVTVKAIAKAVEGMDIESYNQGQGLEPVANRLTTASLGKKSSEVMSLKGVLGVE